jgi:hypothetical protein
MMTRVMLVIATAASVKLTFNVHSLTQLAQGNNPSCTGTPETQLKTPVAEL